MRISSVILIFALTLAACDAPEYDVSHYENDPNMRMVNVDDHKIYVVPTGYHSYIAWGGATDKDGQIQYRQRRAIELISKCRVNNTTSKKLDTVTRATVRC